MSWRVGVCVAFLVGSAAFAADDAPTLPAARQLDFRDRALAHELQRMRTIHPEELVTVLEDACRRELISPSLSLLLAIAHAETSGDVLDISEAGAVGLAQATPVALRQEQMPGKLYVTRDYCEGERAYIMKKPLHDVEVIADDVLEDHDYADAKRLLDAAMSLRREGVDDLDDLEEWVDDAYFAGVRTDDARNLAMLQELSGALDAQDVSALKALRDRAHDAYRVSIERQQSTWKRYQHDLIERRDAFLEERFHTRPAVARREYGYPAGEMLAEKLDVRFSPTKMADFLVRHLERKAMMARSLAPSPDKREEMTAALYNGGTQNVKRMLVGLIMYLPETENYMHKVPAMRKRLDAAVVDAITPVDESDSVIPPFR